MPGAKSGGVGAKAMKSPPSGATSALSSGTISMVRPPSGGGGGEDRLQVPAAARRHPLRREPEAGFEEAPAGGALGAEGEKARLGHPVGGLLAQAQGEKEALGHGREGELDRGRGAERVGGLGRHVGDDGAAGRSAEDRREGGGAGGRRAGEAGLVVIEDGPFLAVGEVARHVPRHVGGVVALVAIAEEPALAPREARARRGR